MALSVRKTVKIADGVVLSDALTEYTVPAWCMENADLAQMVCFYAAGSALVGAGTFTAVLYGGPTEAIANSATLRYTVDATLVVATGAAVVAKKEASSGTTPGASGVMMPWLSVVITRASAAGTGITVDMYVTYVEIA